MFTDCLAPPSSDFVKGKHKQDRQCTYTRNFEARSHNHFYRCKAISVTYSEC